MINTTHKTSRFHKSGRVLEDLTGNHYNRLLVLNSDRSTGKLKWKCKCTCGNTILADNNHLKNNKTRSCGCYNKEQSIIRFKTAAIKNRNGTTNISGSHFSRMRRDAKKRGYEFTISKEYAQELLEKQNFRCALTGLEIGSTLTQKNQSDTTISLDRIDNSKGYVEGNIQWLHKHVNILKNKHSEKYLYELCKMVCSTLKGRYEED